MLIKIILYIVYRHHHHLLYYYQFHSKKVGKKIVGYRVQIISSNNAKSAKSEASSKARQSMSRFPQYRSYVTYSSPYWKVRVGDFQTSQEASSAAAALRGTFGSQVCVVRDYVNAK